MKTKKMMRPIAMAACMLALGEAHAQTSVLGNNPGTPGTDYVGWDNSTTVPLMIRHDANQPIEWYTDAVRRMLLQQSATYTIGSFATQVKDGSLLLSPNVDQFYTNGAPGPYSLLHLAAEIGNAQQQSFRPWMNTGVTFTGNRDHGYIGQKARELDETDMVIHWSDNPGEYLRDRMRFIFTSGYDAGAATGASSWEGLEAMRMFPHDERQVFVGIGDWYAGNIADPSITEPEERLDVLDRTIMVRRLIPDYQDDQLDAVVVSDADGRLHWRDASTLGGQDCDWEITPTNDVVTAYQATAPTDCPDEANNVGIGVDAPQAKLHVFKAVQTSATVETGIYTLMGTDSELVRGVHSIAASGSNTNIGVEAFADNAERNFAVRAIVGTGVGSHNVGVEAHAIETNGNCVTNLAVRGISNPWSPSCGNSWAAWFDGRGYLQDGPWTTSDATLKQDVEPLSGSLELIGQLAPVSYRYDAGHPMYLGADDSRHMGMLAQDLEQVLPELVVDAVRPPVLDEGGEEISPSVNFKAVNYMPLISLLVSGLQEQQVLINEQMNRLDQMEALLLQCCSADGGVGDHRSPEPIGSNTDQAIDRLLRIVPNPFNTPPSIHYTLERDGRMQLMVTSSDGRILRVLEEGYRAAGPYRHDWHTSHLAPGIYYVTLLLDGEPLVQRAVKL